MSGGGSPAKGCLPQLRWAPRHAQGVVYGRLVGRVGQGLERRRRTPRLPVARTSSEPNDDGVGDDEPDGDALDRDAEGLALGLPDAPRRSAAAAQMPRGSAPGPAPRRRRPGRDTTSRQRRASPAASAPSASAMAPTSSRARLSRSPRAGTSSGSRASASEQPRLGLLTDARDVAQPPGGRRLAQLVGGVDAERPGQLDRPLGGQPQVAPEADQLGRELALELGQLGDLPRLHQLAQARLDAGADATQLADPPVGDQLGHRDGRPATVSAARR